MTAHLSADIRDRLDASPMTWSRTRAVILIGALSALDGYDVLAVTFAAPGIGAQFGIAKAGLGVVLASGLAGMGVGSLFIAPLADRFGRRPLVLVTLALMITGMALTAFSGSIVQLAGWRFFTGLGIGAMVAVIAPLASEVANARRRALAVAVMALGYPIGGVVGGVAAAALLQSADWPAVFLLGAGLGLLLLPAIALWAPESIAFLSTRTGNRAADRLENALASQGIAGVELGAAAQTSVHPLVRSIFTPSLVRKTLTFALSNFLLVMAIYYILSWMPQMVTDAGFKPSSAVGISVACSAGGVVGGVLLGLLAPRLGIRNLAVFAYIAAGLAIAAFGLTPPSLMLLAAVGAVVGFFVYASATGAYAVLAEGFPTEVRASGAGFVIGLGRAGSALAPLAAGLLFSAGLSRGGVSILMGLAAVAAGLVLLTLPKSANRSNVE